jgi:hypothetical protein
MHVSSSGVFVRSKTIQLLRNILDCLGAKTQEACVSKSSNAFSEENGGKFALVNFSVIGRLTLFTPHHPKAK